MIAIRFAFRSPVAWLVLIAALYPTFLSAAPAEIRYYVAANGNDAWSGKLAEPKADKSDGPFTTPERARDAVRALRAKDKLDKPVVVYFRAGRYELSKPLTFGLDDSGAEASPTVFAAYPQEKATISGGQVISGWKKGDNEVWTAPLPKTARWSARQLTVNGERRYPARLPKTGFYTVAGLAGADPKAKHSTPAHKFEFKEGDIKSSWKNPADIEVVVLHFWVSTHLKIASVDDTKHVMTFDRSSRRKFTDDYQSRLARYYLLNVAEALTEPGEFCVDRTAGTVSYFPKEGEDLSKATVEMPRLESVIRFEGDAKANRFVERIELRGLTLSDSTWDPPAKDAADIQAAGGTPGAVVLRYARHCKLIDCRLGNLVGYGIDIGDGCRNNHLVGNELAHLGAGGIRVNGGAAGSPEASRSGENVVSDNHLHHLGEIFPSGVGILVQHADQNVVAHNHIHDLYYTGISCGWVWGYAPSVSKGNRIEFNHIHDIGKKLLSDMGGVYLLGIAPGTTVRGNVIHDVDSWTYGGWGIYTDEGSTGVLIEDNLVYRTKSGGFHQHYGKDNVIRNNIFALAREEQVARSRMEPHISFTFERNIVYFREGPLFGKNWKDDKFVIDHNLYWNAAGKPIAFPGGTLEQWRERGHDKDSLIADPKFRDPDKGDFTLADDSPALKIGFKPFDTTKAGIRPMEKRTSMTPRE